MTTDEEREQLIATMRERYEQMARAIDLFEQTCREVSGSFPDGLREALEEIAAQRGGSGELVSTRPGSWEAEHIAALARGADYR